MAIRFDILGNNKSAIDALEEVRSKVHGVSSEIGQEGLRIEDVFRRIGQVTGVAFSLGQAKQFYDKVKETRSYFQDIESSMKVFLGNEKAAEKFTNELKDYAYYNMFEFADLANASKQMIAYGHDIDTVIPRLDQLSNIATGTNADLSELVNLYNRAKSLGVVGSQSLESWATKGLVVKDVLKEMGINVKDATVTFDQLNMVLDKVTAEGGMFHDLMLEQMSNISAEEGQLADNLDAMYNEIGESMQGTITGIVKAESFLVEHYKEVGIILAGLVSSYGLYRASLIATRAVEKAQNRQRDNLMNKALDEEIQKYAEVLDKKKEAINADLAEAVAKGKLTEAQAAEIAAKREMLALLAEEAKAKQAGLVSQVTSLQGELAHRQEILQAKTEEWELSVAEQHELENTISLLDEKIAKGQEYANFLKDDANASDPSEYNDAIAEVQEMVAERAAAAKELEAAATNTESAAEAMNTAQKEVNTTATQLGTAQTELNTIANATNTASEEVNTAATGTNTTATTANTGAIALNTVETGVASKAKTLFALAVDKAGRALTAMGAAMKANPIGLALTGITMAISLFSAFKGEADEATEASERFGEAVEKEVNSVYTLYATLQSTSKSSKVHKDAQKELKQIADEYGVTLRKEADLTKELIKHKEELIQTIKQEAIERSHANQLDNLFKQYESDVEDAAEKIKDKLSSKLAEGSRQGLATAIISSHEQDIAQIGKITEQLAPLNDKLMTINAQYANATYKERQQLERERIAIQNNIQSIKAGEITARESIKKTVEDYLVQLGELEGDEEKYKNIIEDSQEAVLNEVRALGRKNVELNNSIAIIDRAKVAELLRQNAMDGTRASMESMISLAKSLVTVWNSANPTMVLDIDVNTSKVASWVSGMSDEQLKASLRARLNILNKFSGKNANTQIKWGNQTKTLGQLAKEVGSMTAEGQRREDKKNATPVTTPTSTTKTKSAGSTFDPKKAAAENAREMQEYVDKLADDLKDLQRELEDMSIDMREETVQRMLDELQYSEERAQEDIVEKIDELIKERRELNRKQWARANNKDEYLYDNTSEAKVDDSAIIAQIQASQPGLIEALQQQQKLVADTFAKKRQEIYQQDIDALNAYLKEYGDLETRRLAVENEYNEKIAKARTIGERLQLEAQKRNELTALSKAQEDMHIDWEGIFGNLTLYSADALNTLKEQLRGKLNAGDLTVDEYKTVTEKIGEINAAIVEAQAKENGFLGFSLSANKELAVLKKEQADAEERKASAVAKVQDAEAQLLSAQDNVRKIVGENYAGEISIENASDIISSAEVKEGTEEYKNLLGALAELGKKTEQVTKAKEVEAEASNDVANADRNLKAYLKNWQQRLTDFLNSALVQTVEANISALPDLAQSIGLDMESGVGKGLQDFADATQNAMGALEDLASGNFIGAAAKGIMAVRGIGSAFNNILGLGIGKGNTEQVIKVTERLSESNERLRRSVDELKDEMSKQAGSKLIGTYEEALKFQERIVEQQREILKAQNRYTGAHHSNAKNFRLAGESVALIDDLLGTNLYATGVKEYGMGKSYLRDIRKLEELTPEELAMIRRYLPEVWKEILDSGEYDKHEYWEALADEADKVKELTDQLYESLTQISFDSLRDNFLSSLMDMNKSAKDFTEDFESYMQQALLNALIGDEMDEQLKEWYETWAKTMKEQGGRLSSSQLREYKESYNAMAEEALRYRDMVAGLTGYGSTAEEQQATANALSGVSQDIANELVGRITAIQIAGEQRNDLTAQILYTVQQMQTFSVANTGRMDEITNILLSSNSYLEDVARYNKRIYEDFGEKLDSLRREVVALQ